MSIILKLNFKRARFAGSVRKSRLIFSLISRLLTFLFTVVYLTLRFNPSLCKRNLYRFLSCFISYRHGHGACAICLNYGKCALFFQCHPVNDILIFPVHYFPLRANVFSTVPPGTVLLILCYHSFVSTAQSFHERLFFDREP